MFIGHLPAGYLWTRMLLNRQLKIGPHCPQVRSELLEHDMTKEEFLAILNSIDKSALSFIMYSLDDSRGGHPATPDVSVDDGPFFSVFPQSLF